MCDEAKQPASGWQIALGLLGSAAGLGAFLVILGSAVMWIRLDAVGLPAERGLGLVPKQALAVIGARVVAEPLLINLLIVAGSVYVGRVAAIRAQRQDDSARPGSSQLFNKRLALGFVAIALIAIVVVSFTWGRIASILASVALVLVLWHVNDSLDRGEMSVRTALVALTLGTAIAAAAPALAGQADKPSQLEPASVDLRDGSRYGGYFIAEVDGAVFLGAKGRIKGFPQESVQRTETLNPPHNAPAPQSLLSRLLKLL